jgi:hypothetical protein
VAMEEEGEAEQTMSVAAAEAAEATPRRQPPTMRTPASWGRLRPEAPLAWSK